MENRGVNGVNYGPWLVGLGAALWGTESAWRIPLNELFDAQVIVFWEHVLILLMFLPLLISRVGEIRKIDARTWGYWPCPLRLASSLRIVVGLICMTLILLAYGKLHGAALWPVPARAHATKAMIWLALLASISGGIPLLVYFEGCASRAHQRRATSR